MRFRQWISIAALFFVSTLTFASTTLTNVPVLVYHNFDPVKKGSMTLSTQRFEEQIQWLIKNHYTIIPLMDLVNYLEGKINTLPPKSVVITDDDGRKSVYTYMLPIVKKYHFPVTLFIYPGVISRASYALTWGELAALKNTGLFDIESHTYWHPNFKQDKKHLSPAAFEKHVHYELVTSKNVLDKKLGIHITLLAWPFGIHNQELMHDAKNAGYTMAFTIGARKANRSDNDMAVPRYMIIDAQNMKMFEAIVRSKK